MFEDKDIDAERAIPLLRDKIKNMDIAVTDAAIDLDVTKGNPDAMPEEIKALETRLRARKWQRDELQRRLDTIEEAVNPKPKKAAAEPEVEA